MVGRRLKSLPCESLVTAELRCEKKGESKKEDAPYDVVVVVLTLIHSETESPWLQTGF